MARRLGWLASAMVAGTSASLACVAGACSSPAAPLEQGAQCLMTTDCMEGLVCVPPKGAAAGASKICSSNVSSTVSTEDAAVPMKGDGAATDGPKGDAPAGDGMTAVGDATQLGHETGTGADAGGGGSPEAGDEGEHDSGGGALEAGE